MHGEWGIIGWQYEIIELLLGSGYRVMLHRLKHEPLINIDIK